MGRAIQIVITISAISLFLISGFINIQPAKLITIMPILEKNINDDIINKIGDEPELRIRILEDIIGFFWCVDNINASPLTDVVVKITIKDGLLVLPREYTNRRSSIAHIVGYGQSLQTLGFGLGLFTVPPTITASVTCAEGISDEVTVSARVIGPFVKII